MIGPGMVFRQAIFLLTLMCILAAHAPEQAKAQRTTSPFSVLELDASARAAALGGSIGTRITADPSLLYYNPATLNPAMSGTLALTYLNHIGDLNAGTIAYARDVDRIGTVAGGIRFLTWGSTPETDDEGNEVGSFGASDVVLTVSAAREYAPRLNLGISLHGVFSGIAGERASAVAADVGAVYMLGNDRTAVSATLRNGGFVVSSFGSAEDRLPTDLRLTLSHRLEHLPLLLAVTASNLQAPGDAPSNVEGLSAAMRHLSFSGEFLFSETFNVRFGYNHRRHQDLKMNARLDMAGVGAGFGIKVNRFVLDYAFNSWSTLGGLHQFTVRTAI